MDPKKINLIQLNTAVLIWGGTAMFAKGVDLPVPHIICFRSVCAAAALYAFIKGIGNTPILIKRPHILPLFISGLLLCLHWITYFYALRAAGAAVAILALITYPVFTTLIEPLVFDTRFKVSDILLALGVLGGVAIMTPSFSFSGTVSKGIGVGIISGLLYMTRNLITKKLQQDHYSGSVLMYWQVVVTFIVLVPVLYFIPCSGKYTVKAAGLIILLGVVFTALPHTLFILGMQHQSARTAGIINALLPFYGAFFGFLIYNETITARTALGGGVILVCILVETLRSRK